MYSMYVPDKTVIGDRPNNPMMLLRDYQVWSEVQFLPNRPLKKREFR